MEGKYVLLTGGTGGLGLGVTPAILAHQAKLTISYVEDSSVEKLRQQLSFADFERIRFVKADLSNEVSVQRLINDLGRVDVLIHLVGGFVMGKTHEFEMSEWQKCLDLNLTTTFLVCKYCLQKMRHYNYGRIVTIGSRGAVQPAASLSAYCAAKAGVVALTKAIAEETKDFNITANVILPSVIDTPANRKAMGESQADNWVKPESLAEVICFLASEAAGEVRGATVEVYGKV
jgi:NAD(P)-dependent dehydrogenase (short-subunit alcohol dehydrogenase family)